MEKFKLLMMMMLVASMSMTFSACNPDPDPDPDFVSVDYSTYHFDKQGGTNTFSISSNTNWSVSSNQSWVQVSPSSGSGYGNVTVTVGSYDGVDARNCQITITAGTARATINITQEGDPNNVENSTWVEESSYSDGSFYLTTLQFSGSSSATLQMSYTEDSQTFTTTYTYSYRRSDNLVILTPNDAGNAVLEGRIENGVRMTLTNASNDNVVATLYRK